MDAIAKICDLLEQKQNKFAAYEEATQELLVCNVDDVEQYITERGRLATEIDELEREIALACSALPNGDVVMDIARVRVEFGKVPSEYQRVYYAGQAARSVISRIMETEKQAVERLEMLKTEALEGIRQNQNLPKIKKYLTDLGDRPETNLRNSKA